MLGQVIVTIKLFLFLYFNISDVNFTLRSSVVLVLKIVRSFESLKDCNC